MASSNKDFDRITELESLAAEVLQLRKSARPRRPIVLEICGSPKSGKTSCTSSLKLFLRRNGFSTRVLTERASTCPVKNKFSPLFNIWTSNSTIAELAATFAEHRKSLDVIISDRGLFDALCWYGWLLTHDHMSPIDYEACTRYITTDRLRSMVDLVYILTASPNVSMKREYASLLTRKPGSIMNNRVLSEYNEALTDATKTFSRRFRCVRTIDTSRIAQNDVTYQVTKDVLTNLKDLVGARIGYFHVKDLEAFRDRIFWRLSETGQMPPLRYGARNIVESDVHAVQPVPVVVITDRLRTKVVVVRKNPSKIGSDSPEKDKALLYMGGHIQLEDNLQGEAEELASIASQTLYRALEEEMSISLTVHDKDPLVIWTGVHARSHQHMAIVYLYEVDFDRLTLHLDPLEFVTNASRHKSGYVAPISDLHREDLDSWSRIILAEKVGASPSRDRLP
ncbi:MAG: hypothetical protein WC712_08315 [Candidatus Brocadiia bacterium]